MFLTFPVIWGRQSDLHPVFDGLNVIHLRGPKMPGLITPMDKFNDIIVAYLTTARCWLQ